MANLNKKFSKLNKKAKNKLKEQFGSLKAAREVHSGRREALGLKPSKSVSLDSLMLNPDVEPTRRLSTFVGPLQTDDDGNTILPGGYYDDLGITKPQETDPDPEGGRGSFTPPPPDPPPEFTNDGNQFVNDGTTFGLKPGDKIKNVLSGLKIDKKVFKRAFYKDKSGKAPGPLTKKLNQYLDFYDKNSKNTIKVDGKDKNYLQLLKDKATRRMTIDPAKYGRLDKSKYENIKNEVKQGNMENFNELSLAEKYDIGSKNEIGKTLLFKELQRPLTETITEKLDDRLSNFKIGKKGKVKGIKFNQEKFDDYSKAGSEISNRVVDAAKTLGVRNIAGVSGSSGRMDRIKNISDRIKSKAQTRRSSSSDYKKQFDKELKYQPLEYI